MDGAEYAKVVENADETVRESSDGVRVGVQTR